MTDRVAVGAVGVTMAVTFRDAAGMPATSTGVTVGVTDWAGVVVLAPGTATVPAAAAGQGVQVAIPATAVNAVTRLDATWTFGAVTARTSLDVVGSRIVWPEEVLGQPGINSRSPAQIADAITWCEDLFAEAMNWSPVVRFAQPNVDAHGGRFRAPDHYVQTLLGVTWVSAGVADVKATPAELALMYVGSGGTLEGLYPTDRATLAYTHGSTSVAGQDLHDAALIAVRHHLLDQSSGQPILSISDGLGGTTRYAFAGPDRPTGIPDVDAVLNRHRIPASA